MTRPASVRTWALLVGALLLCPATRAVGATCGDADGSGAVTVTDGVQTLRAAAALPADLRCVAGAGLDGSGVRARPQVRDQASQAR